MYTHKEIYMSTEIKITFWSDLNRIESTKLMSKAFGQFARIMEKYTRFNPNSELSKLNSAGGKTWNLDAEFSYLVAKSLEFASFSGGKFDPTIIDLLEINGYKNSFNPHEIALKQAKGFDIINYLKLRPSWKEIKYESNLQQVKLKPNQRLDFGGIGKGYAIDCAAKELHTNCLSFLIDAGGDVYGYGLDYTTSKPWIIDLATKSEAGMHIFGRFQLLETGESIASSGSWARKVGNFHHLLDPHSGKPAENIQTFVVASTALVADVLATTLFLTGKDYIDKISKNYHAKSLLIAKDSQVYTSNDFKLITE